MHYTQAPPLNAQYHERDVDVSDPGDAGTSSEHPRWRRPGTADRWGVRNDPFANRRPSIARRMFRALARFFVAVSIGVGATLGWQTYGDEAKERVRAWDPSLGWLVPAAMTKPTPVTSREVQEHLKPVALDIAALRRNLELFAASLDQFARKEEQMAQSIATIQAAQQQLVQKISSLAAPKPVHAPPPSVQQPTQ
jgi:hypothetical protein